MLQVTDFLPHRSFSALLPSATKLRKGNVFTSVCHSVHGGWQTPPWADTPLTSTCWDTPPAQCMLGYPPSRRPLQRTVRILLECILVHLDVFILLFSCTKAFTFVVSQSLITQLGEIQDVWPRILL